jgi:serine/threonine protein kinase
LYWIEHSFFLCIVLEHKSQKDINRQSATLVSTQSGTLYSAIPFKELILEKEIGEGSFGKVFLGKWNNISIALKFCRRKRKVEEFMKEVNLMMYIKDNMFQEFLLNLLAWTEDFKYLKLFSIIDSRLPPHPNVVQLIGVSMDNESQPVMVMEYCGGGNV